jgi:hypothetical protein
VRNNDENPDIEEKARAVADEYGELASYYAQERSEAALERGDDQSSGEWLRIAQEVREMAGGK